MPSTIDQVDTRAVDHAINRVLAAEEAGRAALKQCTEQAAALVAAAEAQADRISRRTERRIQTAHAIADRHLERVLLGLAKTAAEEDPHDLLPPIGEIDRAIERLIDEMIGPPA
ncbi:hypothetical protein ABC977_13510 [Thioalkalicoccus limnaeus]|uniref:ATPase n=1 Tax=Thioalkalicoccus limnaeus TaxID=120681 RepID=A0ABV4BLT4_9GAMM